MTLTRNKESESTFYDALDNHENEGFESTSQPTPSKGTPASLHKDQQPSEVRKTQPGGRKLSGFDVSQLEILKNSLIEQLFPDRPLRASDTEFPPLTPGRGVPANLHKSVSTPRPAGPLILQHPSCRNEQSLQHQQEQHLDEDEDEGYWSEDASMAHDCDHGHALAARMRSTRIRALEESTPLPGGDELRRAAKCLSLPLPSPIPSPSHATAPASTRKAVRPAATAAAELPPPTSSLPATFTPSHQTPTPSATTSHGAHPLPTRPHHSHSTSHPVSKPASHPVSDLVSHPIAHPTSNLESHPIPAEASSSPSAAGVGGTVGRVEWQQGGWSVECDDRRVSAGNQHQQQPVLRLVELAHSQAATQSSQDGSGTEVWTRAVNDILDMQHSMARDLWRECISSEAWVGERLFESQETHLQDTRLQVAMATLTLALLGGEDHHHHHHHQHHQAKEGTAAAWLIRSGAVPALCRALHTHLHNSSLVLPVLRSLTLLVRSDERAGEFVRALGGTQDAVATLAIHRFQEEIQVSGIEMLASLAGGSSSLWSPAEEQEGSGGGVVRVLPAPPGPAGAVRQVACGAGGGRAVVSAALAHAARPKVQQAAAHAITIFLQGGLLSQVTLLDAGVIKALVSAIHNFPQNLDVQAPAVGALLTLSAESATNKRLVIKGGGKRAIDSSTSTNPTLDVSALLVGRVRHWAPQSLGTSRGGVGRRETGSWFKRFLQRFVCFRPPPM